ncbi:hypothetical protein SK128_024175 [Halocaridina rubra]|uniref:Uncharacterized protein n=1 Tax=Halocaridina rubra TaxID=373956 RepID=A0AAN8XHJ5_HALRR
MYHTFEYKNIRFSWQHWPPCTSQCMPVAHRITDVTPSPAPSVKGDVEDREEEKKENKDKSEEKTEKEPEKEEEKEKTENKEEKPSSVDEKDQF